MNSHAALCQSILASLEWLCRSSAADIEESYPQCLYEDYSLGGPREICATLKAYICKDKENFCCILRTNPNLEAALREFLWLRGTLFPTSLTATEPPILQSRNIVWPTRKLSSLIDEIGESLCFIIDILLPSEVDLSLLDTSS